MRGPDNRPRETRINERIRAREIRVIDENGDQLGIMNPMRAMDIARERNLDLVEISPFATPPVCKLMDYGRFKYEQSKKENEARKRQKTMETKEIRMTPQTDDHDIEVKVKKITEFLTEGDKVKVSVKFRGREAFHPELGRKVLEDIAAALKGIAILERAPIIEGRNMWMLLARAPGWAPPKRQEAAPATAMAAAFEAALPSAPPAPPTESDAPSGPTA